MISQLESLASLLQPLGMIPLIVFFIILTVTLSTTLVYGITTLQYRASLRSFRTPTDSKNGRPKPPPLLPYHIPVLGHGLVFLSRSPGAFHRLMLRQFHTNPQIGCISVLLAGQRAHIIHSPDLVTKLFKVKGLNRNNFNRDIMVKANGLPKDDEFRAYDQVHADGYTQIKANEEHNKNFLLAQNAVNVLTGKFMETMFAHLRTEDFGGEGREEIEVPLYLFLRDRMFVASTVALYGEEIMKKIPDLGDLFWPYENGTLARLFGLGRVFAGEAYKALEKAMVKWEEWVEFARAKGADDEIEMGVEWDRLMGARIIRERYQMYKKMGLSNRGRACFDLGFMFGLNSNAIPASGWLICHLMMPRNKELLAHVTREVDAARRADGSLDVNVLMGATYLNSCFNETMRQYVDVLTSRTLTEDLVLDQYFMRKGDMIIAPTYLGGHDRSWGKGGMPTEDVWFGERFLVYDEKTGDVSFSLAGTAGRLYPFGGGTHMCPGRVFAKQEVFGAIATFLSLFEVEFVEFVDVDTSGKGGKVKSRKGRDERGFPSVKQQYSGAGVVLPEGDLLVKLRWRA